MSDVPTPKNLRAAGRKLFRAVADKYALRPDELRVLEDACHEADIVDTLQAGLPGVPGADLLVKGSMGQQVANPLFGEVRQHRATFAALMRQLSLPDESGESARSVGARKAANARWGKASA